MRIRLVRGLPQRRADRRSWGILARLDRGVPGGPIAYLERCILTLLLTAVCMGVPMLLLGRACR